MLTISREKTFNKQVVKQAVQPNRRITRALAKKLDTLHTDANSSQLKDSQLIAKKAKPSTRTKKQKISPSSSLLVVTPVS